MPLIVLAATVRTTVGFWDTGDLQTVAWIAGIPYPTGFPGYVLLGWLWTHVLPIGEPAARLNALSAFSIAWGAGSVCAIALLFDVLPIFAILGSWTFAFAHTVWQRAAYADAHPVGFAFAFCAVACAVGWERRSDARALVAGIVLAGCAVAIDNTTVLILIGGVVISVIRVWPRRALGAAACALVIAAGTYAWLPWRSAQVTAQGRDPTLALGVAPGRPYWDDHHPADREGFLDLVLGREWNAGPALGRVLTPRALHDAAEKIDPRLAQDLPQGLTVAAVLGLVILCGTAPLTVIGLLIAGALPALFGGSYPVEADAGRYVFTLYAVLAVGIAVFADRAVRAFGARDPAPAAGIAVGLLAIVLARDALRARDIIRDRTYADATTYTNRVVSATLPDAIIVAQWDFATPLAYRAFVLRDIDRRVILTAFADDYAAEIRRWSRTRQVALIARETPHLPGIAVRRAGSGDPGVFLVQP